MKLSELKKLSLPELQALKGRVEQAIAHARRREAQTARRALEKQAKALGFTLEELVGKAKPGRGKPAKAAKPGVARYANPDDPQQTWTGKGRRPAWVIAALNAGKSLDDLKI